MWPNPRKSADMVKYAEEILKEKLHFLCSELRVLNNTETTQFSVLYFSRSDSSINKLNLF